MIKVALYTGAGVSLSPLCQKGAKLSTFVRLVADDGKALTKDGVNFTTCVDTVSVDGWYEKDADSNEATLAEKAAAYDILMGVES